MELSTLLIISVALGTDAFSMCLGIGLAGVGRIQIAIISFTVLIFHIFMPLAGWYIGELAGKTLGQAASIAGAVVLVFLGARMLYGALKNGECAPSLLPMNTWGLFLLAASVSMDALSVGFTLGTQRVSILLAVLFFGLVAGVMTLGGLLLGCYLGHKVGERAQIVGGLILIAIGIKLFF